ncbi:MAG TPA: glycosyltransferase family 9 protein [Alphaproteobacteria bacterium]|nr:glycosyltransferase family 9 protein [Alphaproteobacteria bacterium]
MSILFLSNSRIGDSVLGTCILNYLTTAYPDKSITIVANSLTQSLFKTVPNLKELKLLEKKRYHRHWVDLVLDYRNQNFDWVIDCRGSLASYFLKTKKRSVWKKSSPNSHKVVQLCNWLSIPLTAPKLWLRKGDVEKAKDLFEGEKVLAVAPFANWIGKQWPYFSEFLRSFEEIYPDYKLLLCCSSQEASFMPDLIKNLSSARYHLLTKEEDLLKVAAHLSLCRGFLGNDSGLMHLSACVKTPTIGLFGPSNDKEYGPFGMQSCENSHKIIRTLLSFKDLTLQKGFSFEQRSISYMGDLSVEAVHEKIKGML